MEINQEIVQESPTLGGRPHLTKAFKDINGKLFSKGFLNDAQLIESVTENLHALEANKLKAYVPENKDGTVIGKSGVTIASGLDLGQYNYEDLTKNLKIPKDLADKLKPYLGKRGKAAQQALKTPFEISEEEASTINTAVSKNELKKLTNNFNKLTGRVFSAEPNNVKQALLIASYNLGSSLKGKSLFSNKDGSNNNFAKQIIDKDYVKAGDNMATWNTKAALGLQKRYRTQGQLLKGTIGNDAFVDQLPINLDILRKAKDTKTPVPSARLQQDEVPKYLALPEEDEAIAKYNKFYDDTEKTFGPLNGMPEELQDVLVQMTYKGDADPSRFWVQDFNEGRYAKAADAITINREYMDYKQEGSSNSVTKRVENASTIFNKYDGGFSYV